MEIWEPKPPGTLLATPGLLQDSFTFYTYPYILYIYYQDATLWVYSAFALSLVHRQLQQSLIHAERR